MSFDPVQMHEIIEVMEDYLSKERPPEHMRDELDIGYQIEDQSILIVEIRPQWKKPTVKGQYPYAKATFVKSKNYWKVFWLRADMKWHAYTPKPTVKTLKKFLELVDEDAYHCFKG